MSAVPHPHAGFNEGASVAGAKRLSAPGTSSRWLAVACLVMAGMLGLVVHIDRKAGIEAARQSATLQAEALAQQAGEAMTTVQVALDSLTDAMPRDAMVRPVQALRWRMRRWVESRSEPIPQLRSVALIGQSGSIITEVTVRQSGDAEVPGTSAVDPNGEQHGVVIAQYPVGEASGDGPALALAAFLEPTYFQEAFSRAELGQAEIGAALVAADGTVVARNSYLPASAVTGVIESIGTNAAGDLRLDQTTIVDGSTIGRAGPIVAAAPVPRTPFVAIASTSNPTVLSGWHRLILLIGLGMLVTVGTVSILVEDWFGARRLRPIGITLPRLRMRSRATVAAPAFDTVRDRAAHTVAKAIEGGTAATMIEVAIEEIDGSGNGELANAIAERLRRSIRAGDIVAWRKTGTFVVVAPNLRTPDDAPAVADKILTALSTPFEIGRGRIEVRPVIGLAVSPTDGTDIRELEAGARSSLEHAKSLCRLKPRSPAILPAQRGQWAWTPRIRAALEQGDFFLEYQPQVDCRTRTIIGVEALARWHDDVQGPISPAVFMPVAEASGLIHQLGAWALREACQQQVMWRRSGLEPIAMAVNISARQFRSGDLPGVVRRILDETGADPTRLQLEITESTLMQSAEQTEAQLDQLTRLGVRIAVDDFGTGYSSLAYLKRFPVSCLKIDRSFVEDLLKDPDDLAIVQAIITMARKLGLRTVAEGVEHEGQFELLSSLGCDVAQGFLLGRPARADEVPTLLHSS